MRPWCLALAAEVALAAGLLATAACGEEAVLLEIRASGFQTPAEMDAFCLAVGDTDPGGGEFASHYLLGDGEIGNLPQTLAIDAGEASEAFAWVRGYRDGIEVARDAVEFAFDGSAEVTLTMARCPGGPGGAPAAVAVAAVPAGSRVALSIGRTGSQVVAAGDGAASALRAQGGALAELDVALPSVGGVLDLVAFDADADCDDDLLVIPAEDPPVLWQRASDGSFAELAGALEGAGPATAGAVADVDGDGAVDVALGGVDGLVIWLNGGEASFSRHPTAVAGDAATDVTRLGFGDVDGDGDVDLVVGRGGAAPATSRVLFNDGGGAFETEPGVLPEVPQKVRALAVRDMNEDGFADVIAAGEDMAVRLYINRTDGRLEDQSFVWLPTVDPVDAASLTAADWDGDCLADLVVGLAAGGEPLSWHAIDEARLEDDGSPAVAGERVLLGDADDDGDLDLLTVSAGAELGWAAR